MPNNNESLCSVKDALFIWLTEQSFTCGRSYLTSRNFCLFLCMFVVRFLVSLVAFTLLSPRNQLRQSPKHLSSDSKNFCHLNNGHCSWNPYHMSEPVNARVNAFTRWFSAVMSFRYPNDTWYSVLRRNFRYDATV